MNDFILGQWLNSQVTDVPLNHLIWLSDYKTYGTSSYVYNDKNILHELYKSPISANDKKVISEALNYLLDYEDAYVGKFIHYMYRHRNEDEWLQCDSVDDIATDTSMLNLIAQDKLLMDVFEKNNTFKVAVQNNPDVTTKTVATVYNSSAANNPKASNALVLSVTAGCMKLTYMNVANFYRPSVNYSDQNAANKTLIYPDGDENTYSQISKTDNNIHFAKSLSIDMTTLNGKGAGGTSVVDSVIKYIQLSGIV